MTDSRPYREARVVEVAGRYKDQVDYAQVFYPGKVRWFKSSMEWVYVGNLSIIYEEAKREAGDV